MSNETNSKLRKLPVQVRETLGGPGPHLTELSVFCPTQAKSVGIDGCAHCPNCVALDSKVGGFVQCHSGSEPEAVANPTVYRTQRLDMGERAARLRVGEIMSRRVVCVRAEASVESLRTLLLENALDCVPVVDESGGPIGIVTKTDLVRLGRKDGASQTVGEIMTNCVHALPDDSSLAHTFALMTLERLQQIPIVSTEGTVVGLFTALDALKWVTDGWGYVSFDRQP